MGPKSHESPTIRMVATLSKKHKNSSKSKKPHNDRPEEPSGDKKTLPLPPKSGSRPILQFLISWGKEEERSIRVMLDTGSSTCVISKSFVSRFSVPVYRREIPVPFQDFAGREVPGSGEAFTFPLKIRYGKHVVKETFEMAPCEEDCDAILPFWWMCKHPPISMFDSPDNPRIEFSHPRCKQCTEERVDDISFEWDEEISSPEYYEVVGTLGRIAAVKSEEEPQQPPARPIAEVLPAEYHRFLHVFDREVADRLPDHRDWDHAIDLVEGAKPPWGPIYALSEVELEALRKWLDEMLEQGKIRPSKSPAGAPILFVPKAHGRGLRLCVDYRGLNRVTVLNRFALPLMSELRDRTQGAIWFSKIDLKNGYNLIRIKKGDEWKTAFRTRYGHYEFLVMPFGLTNAPATFQEFIQSILRDLLDQGVVVYIDDILIYSKTMEEHQRLVTEVLRRLATHNLAAAADKCVFHVHEVEFLGYIIGQDGIAMSKDKVEAIRNWEPPRSVKDVQAFLGFANFYRRFIEGFSRVAKPLTDLTKKSLEKFRLTPEGLRAFNVLKARFASAPILKHFDPNKPAILETDASDFAIGAVLSQVHDKRSHPVAFYSRKMSPAEINYDIHDKEMLAIVAALEEWRHYLQGGRFPTTIFTDHKNLEYFMTTKVLNRRQARWAERLSEYDFSIIYRKGSSNGKADSLSRRSEYRPQEGDSVDKQPVTQFFRDGQLDLESINQREEDMVISVASLSRIRKIQFDSQFLEKVKRAAEEDEIYGNTLAAQERAKEKDDKIAVVDGLLYFKDRLWLPDSDELRLEVARIEHDSKVAGHFGMEKTEELMTRNFYWPGMSKWIADYVRSCHSCQQNKSPRHLRSGLLQPLELPFTPWESISMDFITGLPEVNGNDSIWVIVDRFTKMAHFIPLQKGKRNARDCARTFIREIWKLHGLPRTIVSDRDPIFTSNFWASLMEFLDIKRSLSSAYHPQTDGQTERVNQTVEHYLRAFCSWEQDDWVDLLPLAEYTYNDTVTSATGITPFYANYGRHPQTRFMRDEEVRNPASTNYAHWLKAIHDYCRQQLEKTRERMSKNYDKKHSEAPKYKKGDLVMVNSRNWTSRRPSRKLDHKLLGPLPITEVIREGRAYRVQLPKRMRRHDVLHVSLLEPYREPRIAKRSQPGVSEALSEVQRTIEDEPAAEDLFTLKQVHDSREWNEVEYLVEWEDYPNAVDWTWEEFENVRPWLKELREFHDRFPDKPRHEKLSMGRGKPKKKGRRTMGRK